MLVNRIFTRVFGYTETLAGATTLTKYAKEIYKAEENMVLVGVSIHLHPAFAGPIANDGHAVLDVEVTPNADWLKPGGIINGVCEVMWNTTPAAVYCNTDSRVMMFPDGEGIPIMEEGVINLVIAGSNTSAADVQLVCDVYLYLVRGTAR